MKSLSKLIFRMTVLASVAFLFFIFSCFSSQAATLSVTPNSGTYEVGSTFDVSIMLNTEGESINAVKTSLSFSQNTLQIVSPSAGNSIVTLWASPPTYNNNSGTVALEGGFPGGTNVTNGLITKITFRVKSTGTAIVKFQDDSKVLLDDGDGTETLDQTNSGIYTLTLPPPDGPQVISETHPDQSRWYNNSSVVLKWADTNPDLVEEYSYVLSDNLTEIPDDISDNDKSSIIYKNLSDGRHYFHIKALNKDKIWGGTTHYALNIDNTPPAEFSIDIFPSKSTVRRNPIVQFITTDASSGIGYYNLKVIPLTDANYVSAEGSNDQKMFIEAKSPYLTQNLEMGRYDVIVRAYDLAGNYRDSIQKLKITNVLFQFVSDEGLVIRGHSAISWLWFFSIVIAFIFALVYVIYRLWHLHRGIEKARYKKRLPPDVQQKMEELKRLKEKYKGLVAAVILAIGSFFLVSSAKADDNSLEIDPPLITVISKNISNDEIFYAGGKAETDGERIILYIKNTRTGETFNEEILADNNGEWFYRHDTFLSGGEYILWAQGKIGEQMSPPSPQVKMAVTKTAFQIGSSRISYEFIFSSSIGILFLIIAAMIFYIFSSTKKIREKEKLFKKEVDEVESAVHKGFTILHREINKELKLLEEMTSRKALSEKEINYREHLMNDLKRIEDHIEKEIVDVEKLLS